jgi:hypothetical protein
LLGKPLRLSATELAAPVTEVVTVTFPEDPREMLIEDGAAEIVKSAGAVTSTWTKVV